MPTFLPTLHPDRYHGHNKKPPFFEGWYYKLISADGAQRLAVIPGVFLGEDGHAFVQVLDGAVGRTDYVRFALSEFWASKDKFEVRVGNNHFDAGGLSLDLDSAWGKITGGLRFDGANPWPVSLTLPGIMGWYAWVPFMETYHGVVSLDHAIEGALSIAGETVDFSSGRGYIEKDWGQAFPEGYIWFQSNHFQHRAQVPDQQAGGFAAASLTASVAIIPWVGRAFRGFIVGLWLEGHLHRFATYSGAKIEKLELTEDTIDWVIRDRRHRLLMFVRRAEGGIILGPTRGEMSVRVDESISAEVDVRLETLGGELVFEGTGRHTGLEVQGDLERLLGMG